MWDVTCDILFVGEGHFSQLCGVTLPCIIIGYDQLRCAISSYETIPLSFFNMSYCTVRLKYKMVF